MQSFDCVCGGLLLGWIFFLCANIQQGILLHSVSLGSLTFFFLAPFSPPPFSFFSPVAIRMYVPPDPDADPAEKEAPTAAETLQQTILNSAYFRKTSATADAICQFPSCSFLTPRGRYALELFASFLRMRGPKYDYKIRYDDISRLYLLPKPDEVHMAFVIALDKPIRQGQQRYQYLVLQASKEPNEITVNLDGGDTYNGELQPVMRGSYSNLIAKTFKIITKKKVLIPGHFQNASQQACLNCSVRANEGHLYPLEKQFVFIHKPPIIVRFSEIESVDFQRYSGGASRGFDLAVLMREGGKEYTFSGIDRADYTSLYNFLTAKDITIVNMKIDDGPVEKPSLNDEEIFGAGKDDDDDEEESEDESYGKADAEKDETKQKASDESGSSEDDMDDDELGSEVDEGLDSDLEEARDTTPKKTKKKKAESEDDDDDEAEEVAASPRKKRKKKDANAPKRAMSAYMFFMNSNRDRIKEENPDAAFSEIVRILWYSILFENLYIVPPTS